LDGWQAGLDLPAVEGGAVVGDGEFESAHRGFVELSHGGAKQLHRLEKGALVAGSERRSSGHGVPCPYCERQMRYCEWARENLEPGRVGMPPARHWGHSSGS
jgi:hypothetical protein